MKKLYCMILIILAINMVIVECKRIETKIQLNNPSQESLEKLDKYIRNINNVHKTWHKININGHYHGDYIRVYLSSRNLHDIIEKLDYLKKLSSISVSISSTFNTLDFTDNVRVNFKELINTFDNECRWFICEKKMELVYYAEDYMIYTFKITEKQEILQYINKLIENQNNVIF